ncbi:methyltransferase [Streptomyces acidiscabies]|uniref:methyltransferase n=1 Tax=Streptomyces acidiscabies TaxID=42234 RepID=UPI0038F76E39
MNDAPRSPHEIISLATAFWTSKALLSAVELKVFAALAAKPRTAEELAADLALKGRGARDLFDVLVSVGVLERSADGVYSNSGLADTYLNPAHPATDITSYLEYLNSAFPAWSQLSAAVRSGGRLNRNEALAAAADGGRETVRGGVLLDGDPVADTFGEAYSTPQQVTGFVRSMTGFSLGAHLALTTKFDWSAVRSVVDVGCAEGAFLTHVLAAHDHLEGTGFDLPQVEAAFTAYLGETSVAGRAKFAEGDFFQDPLPSADVIVMGHVLHDWNLDIKKMLIRKAYEALPESGTLLVYEMLIDDDRRRRTTGMLTSLNVSLASAGGLGYTGAECRSWLLEAGFREVAVSHLDGPDHMVIGVK